MKIENVSSTQKASSLHSRVRRLVGWSLLLSPFIAIAVFVEVTCGWLAVAAIYGLTALTVGVIYLGVVLTE